MVGGGGGNGKVSFKNFRDELLVRPYFAYAGQIYSKRIFCEVLYQGKAASSCVEKS